MANRRVARRRAQPNPFAHCERWISPPIIDHQAEYLRGRAENIKWLHEGLDLYQQKIDREAAEVEALPEEEFQELKAYVQYLWRHNCSDAWVDRCVTLWLLNPTPTSDTEPTDRHSERSVARGLVRRDVRERARRAHSGDEAWAYGDADSPPSPSAGPEYPALLSPAFKRIVTGLDEHGLDWEWQEYGVSIMAQCPDPDHPDEHPSFGVTWFPEQGGHLKMNCISQGCDKREGLAAIGRTFADCYDRNFSHLAEG